MHEIGESFLGRGTHSHSLRSFRCLKFEKFFPVRHDVDFVPHCDDGLAGEAHAVEFPQDRGLLLAPRIVRDVGDVQQHICFCYLL